MRRSIPGLSWSLLSCLAFLVFLGSAGLGATSAWAADAPRVERQPLAFTVPVAGAPTEVGPAPQTVYRQRACCERIRWRIEFPLWAPGISQGSFAIDGEEIEADDSDDDILDWLFPSISNLEFYFVGLVQARKGPWGITLDTFGGTISSSQTFRLTNDTIVKGDVTVITPRGIITRRVAQRRWGSTEVEALAYVGARAYILSLGATLLDGIELFDEGTWWVDPIVGLRFEATFGRHWHATLAGDIGGFGAGSNFAWWVGANVGYRFSRTVGLGLGWTLLDVDYTGTKADGTRVDFDIQLVGPTLYLTFDF